MGGLGHKMHFPTKFLLVLLVRKQLNRNILMKRKLVLGSDAVVKCITFFTYLFLGELDLLKH